MIGLQLLIDRPDRPDPASQVLRRLGSGLVLGVGNALAAGIIEECVPRTVLDAVDETQVDKMLVDGDVARLTDVGVRAYRTVAFKRLDEDFFSEE